jgi:predicted anti-sigma-YlaC factor YlaD
MTCDTVRDLLPAWLDRNESGLSEEQRRLLAAHLETCAACRQSLRELEDTMSHVRALPRMAMPPRARARAKALGEMHAHEGYMAPLVARAGGAAVRRDAVPFPASTHAARARAPHATPAPDAAPVQESAAATAPPAAASRRGARTWVMLVIAAALMIGLVYWWMR